MADPFSIVASTAGLLDISIKVVRFIVKTKDGTGTIDEDLRQLTSEVEDLRHVTLLIQQAFREDMREGGPTRKSQAASIWSVVSSALKDCGSALTQLNSVLEHVKGEEGSSKFDRLRRHFRKLANDEDFVQLRQRLDKGHQILQMSLTALNIIATRQSQIGNYQSIAALSAQMTGHETKLGQIIQSLETAPRGLARTPYERDGIETAKTIKELAWLNVHFMIPQPVSNLFVGRKLDFANLKKTLENPDQTRTTRRVVIYGLNGSGKTQFCCKFAQDHRLSFWGVFFIDATSSESVRSSYADIAQRAGIEPNESNVKHWLSEQTKPWLLIVDNADDHLPSHAPQDFIPESASGIVLLTTRNHLLRTLGNLAIKFEGLEEDLSAILLLTSADRPRPFASKALQMARDICRKFGHLPLAILHAGKAILQGTCTLDNCLEFVERSLNSVRKIIYRNKADIATPLRNDEADGRIRTTSESVYATFEMVIPAASEKAVQILRLLSFMQSQRFYFQILLNAVLSPRRQIDADKQLRKSDSATRTRSWYQISRDILRGLHRFLEKLGERPVLPSILRSLEDADPKDAEFALRELLSGLRALALLDHDEEEDTYCMHSSVNWWIRASMNYQEKEVWCHAASEVLASAILLPPVGTQDGDVQLRRQALPHIQYVRKQEDQLRDELRRKQKDRGRSWPSVEPTYGRAQILRDAKFSLVFAESGMWRESQRLMLIIDKCLVKGVGLDNPIAIRARLFLSETHWWLGEPSEAVRLQKDLFTACERSLGSEHVDTLNVMDRLGMSFWQLGQFHNARTLAQKAADGFKKTYLSGHVDTSRALTNLGRCVSKFADFNQAVKLQSEALYTLESTQQKTGVHHSDQILDVMENLAMARHDRHRYGDAQKDDLQEAERLQCEVLVKHTEKLGKEHPKSLWASCNLARIKASTGALEEAEQMIKRGLPIAERTIGADHIGTLMGKAYLGQVLTLAGKLDEAEGVLVSVVDAHRARDGQDMHPDHLVAAALLLSCYRCRSKHQLADGMQRTVVEGIRHVFGEGSPWEDYFVGHYLIGKKPVIH